MTNFQPGQTFDGPGREITITQIDPLPPGYIWFYERQADNTIAPACLELAAFERLINENHSKRP